MTEGRKLHAGLVLALALVLAFLPATVTVAAGNDSGQASQSSSNASGNSASTGNASGMAPEDVTDQHLEKFAAAYYQQMQQVRSEYGKKMQQAKDNKAKQKQLRKEGQQEMVSAIRDEGLKIAEYRQIGKVLNNDKELRSRIREMMKEQQSGSSGNSESGSS